VTIQSEQAQLTEIIDNICYYMLQMVSAKGLQAAEMRRVVGLVRVNGLAYLQDKTFGTNLWNCFVAARTLPITADTVAMVRQQIMALQPTDMIATLVVETSIIYCLTTECLFITQTTFKSRDDVQQVMNRMTTAFNAARDQAADRMDSLTYENLTALAGSIINHLSSVALTLPRLVHFNFGTSWPALSLANLIYQDASRWQELVDENKVVHPAFMPRSIAGLSA
jgi:prophage DNA circulation protein